jgi:hypothetical protein
MGGTEVLLSASELKALGKLTDVLKQQKSLFDAQLEIRKKLYTIEVKQAFSGKAETKNYQDRLKLIGKIDEKMTQMGKDYADSIMRGIIPRTSGPKYNVGAGDREYNKATAMSGDAQWEAATGSKRVENQRKEVGLLDVLKKKYAWQLLYFTALAGLFTGMVANSKILQHFQDVIGAGLGFILDMLLVALIPAVIVLVGWLFKIGEFFSGLPDVAKLAILAVGVLFAMFTGAQATMWLAEVASGITGIGTAASTAAGAGGVGALSVALSALAGLAAGGIVVKILDETGALKKISDAGAGLRESPLGGAAQLWARSMGIEAGADIMNAALGTKFATPTYAKEHPGSVTQGSGFGSGSTPVVNVFIDGTQLSQEHMRTQQLRNGVGI